MNGTSPGNMPVSLGNVWIGKTRSAFDFTTACNNTPYQYPLTAELANTTTVIDPGMPSTGACPACGCTIVGAHLGGCPVRDAAVGHARVQWYENMTDEQRRRIVECAPNPWIDQNAKMALLRAPLTAPPLSDADVERIAQRVVELTKAEMELNKQDIVTTRESVVADPAHEAPIK